VNAFAAVLWTAGEQRLAELRSRLRAAVLRHRVGDRPNRYEPRRRKRRPKPYALLSEPRSHARSRLAVYAQGRHVPTKGYRRLSAMRQLAAENHPPFKADMPVCLRLRAYLAEQVYRMIREGKDNLGKKLNFNNKRSGAVDDAAKPHKEEVERRKEAAEVALLRRIDAGKMSPDAWLTAHVVTVEDLRTGEGALAA
jgi:hypothetical protein